MVVACPAQCTGAAPHTVSWGRDTVSPRGAAAGGAPAPVFYGRVVRVRADDPASPLVAAPGLNRLNVECWLLARTGVNVDALSRTQRVTLQFLFDGIFPFVVLLAVSLLTRPTDPKRVALFYGKMKTPVGRTPELEVEGLEATLSTPPSVKMVP